MKKILINLYNHLWYIVMGSLKIVIGVNFLQHYTATFEIVIQLLIAYIFIQFLGSLFQFVIGKDKSKGSSVVLNTFLIFIIKALPGLPFKTVLTVIGAMFVLQGAAQLIQFYIEYRNKVESRFGLFGKSLIYTIFGLVMIVLAWTNVKHGTWALAIYCLISGSLNILNGIFNWIPTSSLNKFKRRVRITPPVFMDAVMPRVFLERLDHVLAPVSENGEDGRDVAMSALERPLDEYKVKFSDVPTRLKVMIHVSPVSFGQVGHIDVSLDEIVYSYGSYDFETHLIGGLIGDGVFFEAPRMPYVGICKDEGKTLFVFGIKTTPEQEEKIIEEINSFKNEGVLWESNFDRGVPIEELKPLDYASKLSYQAGAKLYKFPSGRYKKYFGLTTNCVLVADKLLGPTGSNLFKNTGVLTPGTYLSYLYEQSQKEHSNVVSFTIE